jgi:UDP-N-acetylmuramyl pentapeptide phosphotransferase/UDP-N-acetylglucosamine-1-phosphate transferase
MMNFAALAAFLTALAVTPLIRRLNIVDLPNDRSSHALPTPRSGGIAIVAGIVAGIAVAGHMSALATIVIVALVIAAVGLWDDVRGSSAALRLVLQLVAAFVVALFAGVMLETIESLPLAWAAVPVTVFWIVGVTNAYNFMDGVNGIASVEAIVCGVVLAVLFDGRGDAAGVALALAIAASAAGFLPWNFPKARIFMGDVSSGTLGFLIAVLVIRYATDGGSVIAAALPLLPFLADTAITLVRRAIRRERLMSAHRSHFYQRFNALVGSHTAVTALWGVLALVSGGVAIAYESAGATLRLVLLAAVVLVHVATAVAIMLAEGRRRATPAR